MLEIMEGEDAHMWGIQTDTIVHKGVAVTTTDESPETTLGGVVVKRIIGDPTTKKTTLNPGIDPKMTNGEVRQTNGR